MKRAAAETARMEAAEAELRETAASLAANRSRLEALGRDNAARVIRREAESLAAKAPKLARSPEKWKAAVLEFYGGHAGYVAKTLRIDESVARAYCDSQAAAVLAGGISMVKGWEGNVPTQLVALATGGEE